MDEGGMSKCYLDAIDKVKGGVSYPPNLADAKEETPNGQNGIPCRTTKEEKRGSCGCRVVEENKLHQDSYIFFKSSRLPRSSKNSGVLAIII